MSHFILRLQRSGALSIFASLHGVSTTIRIAVFRQANKFRVNKNRNMVDFFLEVFTQRQQLEHSIGESWSICVLWWNLVKKTSNEPKSNPTVYRPEFSNAGPAAKTSRLDSGVSASAAMTASTATAFAATNSLMSHQSESRNR